MLLRSAILAGVAAVAAGSLLRARTKARASLQATPYVGSDKKRCLLISNSKLSGLEYLDHVLDHIRNFLGDDAADATVVFVPYAQRDRDAYADKFRKAFAPISSNVVSLHECEDLRARRSAVRDARAIFVGGGNTFRLLKCLQDDAELMPLIASRVASGELAYIGSSAGSNVACPTIRNTNDMPIVWPAGGLGGLGLVPFQLNTHYIDEEREVKAHMGESRATRLREFVEENDVPVLALREGSSVRVDGESATLLGPVRTSSDVTWRGARLVTVGAPPRDVEEGASLDFLMELGAGGADVRAMFDVAPLMSDAGQEKRRKGRAASGDAFKSG